MLLINTHQQCQMWQSGGLLTVGHVGQHLWAGNLIFGKEWRSLHSPLFSGRTPGGLRRTQPIQNAEFSALELLELSGDFPVTFRCMLAGLVSPTDFSGRQSGRNITKPAGKSTGNHRTTPESPTESSGKSNGQQRKVQRSPTDNKQTSLLIIIINKKSDIDK